MKQKHFPLLLFVIALLCVLIFNEWNLSTMRSDKILLRHDTTVITADDPSYIRPMERLYEYGSLYTNETEKWTSIIRSPGYGLIYYGALCVVGKEHALTLLKWIQYILYALSVVALYFFANYVFNDSKWSLIPTFLYACWPAYYSFLAYTLTEALTPALFIFIFYFMILGIQKNQLRWCLIVGFLGGWLILTRPVMGMFMISIPIVMWLNYKKKIIPLLIVTGLLALPIFGWQIRHKIVLGSFQSFHPIYLNEISGMYRLPHQSLWNLVKSWEHESASFHKITGSFWQAANQNKEAKKTIKNFISELPEHVRETIGVSEWEDYLQKLYVAIQVSEKSELSDLPLPEEEIAALKAGELKQKYIAKHWFDYGVITPLKVFKELTFHSNLPYYAIQGKYRGNSVVEVIRWISFFLYSSGIFVLLTIPILWMIRFKRTLYKIINHPRFLLLFLLVMTASIYLCFLAFYQRGIEERYTTPILWIGLIGGVYFVRKLSLRKCPRKEGEV